MKFKERLQKVLQALGFGDKAKNNELSAEDWKKIEASYKETHGSDLYADMKENKEQAEKANAHDEALKLLNADKEETPEAGAASADEKADEGKEIDLTAEVKKIKDSNADLKKKNEDLEEKVNTLSQELENDNPKTETVKITGFALNHTEKHAFGIDHANFSTEKRWNKIAVNPKYAILEEPKKADEKAFKTEVNAFGESLAARYAHLKANNQLDVEKLMATSTTADLSEVGAALGNYYVIRRQDALIARLLKIRTVYDFMPRRYGVQDMDVINNVLLTEVSQAWQSGKVFKGTADVQPEMGHVDDASIKLKFEPLVDLERNYLGYLNTEGSDPIKWGMIEWYALTALEKAVQEQTKRRVMGCYIKPETDTAGKAINASTGFYYTLIRYIHQNKLNPIADTSYASYTASNMYDTIKAFLDAWVLLLGDQDRSEFTLVLNDLHKTWWLSNIRTKFGNNSDFAGPKSNVFPDYDIPIYWMPAAGTSQFVVLTKAGNVQAIENKPGEMLALSFETDFEDVLCRARWKEGVSAAFVGPKFSSKALLEANNYENQQIFMNKPATVLAADATALDGSVAFPWFVTQDNTGATAISALPTSHKAGNVYVVECGGTADATTIAQAGSYAGLTAAWTPTAVGDYIMFAIDDAGTGVRELERCVGGTRTVNSAVQPTLPEARA